MEVLRPLLTQDCDQIEELHYTGEMAEPFDEQTQIDCSGLDVFGARRDVEFMFNDGPLGHVWVHIQVEEFAELQEALVKAFGQVVHKAELYEVFACGTVALHQDPPEVLVATPEMVAELTGYRGDYR